MTGRTTAEIVADLQRDYTNLRVSINGQGHLPVSSLKDAADRLAELGTENERLRVAILDIDAHATPLGEDDDGFVAVGYAVSVGAIHRALGTVGHSAPQGIVGEDADFVAMLYDLVPKGVGIPLGASALIWRAARELEALDALRLPCPTCGGTENVADSLGIREMPCPDCTDGRMSHEQAWKIVANGHSGP